MSTKYDPLFAWTGQALTDYANSLPPSAGPGVIQRANTDILQIKGVLAEKDAEISKLESDLKTAQSAVAVLTKKQSTGKKTVATPRKTKKQPTSST